MYSEDELSYKEKEQIVMNYLTLLYEFFPTVSPGSKEFDIFAEKYTELYSKGKGDIRESIDQQREEISKVLPKEKEKTPEPAPAPPKPPEPAPAPAPAPEPVKPKKKLVMMEEKAETKEEPKLDIVIPDGTEEEIKTVIGIYSSSDSVQVKKEKLGKFKKPQLEKAWDIISRTNPSLRHPAPKKNIDDYVNCLSNDPTHTCNSSRKKGGESKKQTRRKKI